MHQNKKLLLSTGLLALSLSAANAQDLVTDTLDSDMLVVPESKPLSPFQQKVDKLSNNRWFQSTYIAVPLIAGGLIEKHQDTKFRKLRNDFLPEFHRTLDNYLQVTPAAITVGLKALGVPSRSSWGRLALSSALSAGVMATVVNGLKYSTHQTRPDGTDTRSFPSGHTATAFTTATILSKEYGHLSPWVSVGAYAVATTTGLMRIANNKHWLSDVMAGAGIGILSTEFGYWIADAICKDRGLNDVNKRELLLSTYDNPSFLGLYMGFNLPLSHYDLSEEEVYRTSTGTTAGIEGAWFLNPYVGVGGRWSISNIQYTLNNTEASRNTFDFNTLSVGPYFSLPITPHWRAGSKLLAQYTWYHKTDVGSVVVPRNSGLGVGTGLNIDYRAKRNLEAGIFLDYNIQPPHSLSSGEYMHTMVLGARTVVRF